MRGSDEAAGLRDRARGGVGLLRGCPGPARPWSPLRHSGLHGGLSRPLPPHLPSSGPGPGAPVHGRPHPAPQRDGPARPPRPLWRPAGPAAHLGPLPAARVSPAWSAPTGVPSLLAGALFYLPFFGLPFAIHRNPEVAYLLQDPQSLAHMEEMYRSGNEKFGRKNAADTDVYMFGFYIWNNVRITFQVFASGLLLGLGSDLLPAGQRSPGRSSGRAPDPHGRRREFLVLRDHPRSPGDGCPGAGRGGGSEAGLRPAGPRAQDPAAVPEGRRPERGRLVYGAALLDVLAAFLEAFWSSSALVPATVKFAVGGSLWAAPGRLLPPGWEAPCLTTWAWPSVCGIPGRPWTWASSSCGPTGARCWSRGWP